MAINVWTAGAGTSNLATAGNWSTAVPLTGDTVQLIRQYTGTFAPTTNADTAFPTQLIALFVVGDGWTFDVGTSGNPLTANFTKLWTRATAGKLWFADSATANTAWVICDSTSSNPLGHDCLSLNGATTTLLEVLRGMTTVIGGTVTDFVVASRSAAASEAKLVLNSGATISTSGEQYAGIVSSSVAVPTAIVNGGVWTQEASAAGTITTLKANGGRVNLNYAGTYATVRHRAGCIIDVTQDGGTKTFTNYYRYPGSILIGENSGLLTIANSFDVRN
jgi:hypothetical protein